VLNDGTYDVFVIDAEDALEPQDALRLELTVTQGPYKGDVVTVIAQHLPLNAVQVLGLPATLVVEHGQPRVELS
jgi:hypothetical protein